MLPSCEISSFWSQGTVKGVLMSCDCDEKSVAEKSVLKFLKGKTFSFFLPISFFYSMSRTKKMLVLFRVLQRNRTNRIYTERYVERDLLREVSSCDYAGREVPLLQVIYHASVVYSITLALQRSSNFPAPSSILYPLYPS